MSKEHKKLINKDDEQKNRDWWRKEDNDVSGPPTTIQTAEEMKNGLTETEPNEYRKNRLRLSA